MVSVSIPGLAAVGLILCSQKNAAVAKYALVGLESKILASEYRLALPQEAILTDQLAKARTQLEKPGTTN